MPKIAHDEGRVYSFLYEYLLILSLYLAKG